jgi:hypothetical protein
MTRVVAREVGRGRAVGAVGRDGGAMGARCAGARWCSEARGRAMRREVARGVVREMGRGVVREVAREVMQ